METLVMKKKVFARIRLLLACAAVLRSAAVLAQANSGLLIHSLPGPPASNQKPDASARDVQIGNPKAAIKGLTQQYGMIRLTGFQSELPGDVEGYRFVSQYFPLHITADDWERISHEIFDHYTSRGKMVRVDLVMKEDKSAVVDISELRIHTIKVKNPGLRDADVVDINRLLREYVKEGEVIDLKKLKAFLSRIDYRGVETVTAKFLEITADGVDLNITVEPRQIAAFDAWAVGADNYGTDGFGWGRVNAAYSAPLFSPGDNLGVQTVVSRGLQNISGRYDFPLPGLLPLRGSVWASTLQYSAEIDGVRERGSATLGGVDLNYPYFFWSGAQLVGGFGYEYKWTKDEILALDSTRKTVDNLHVRINGSGFFNNRISFFGDWLIGHLDLGGVRAPLQDMLTAKTKGSFQKFVWGADFLQPVSAQTYLTTSARGQVSNKNLDSLEKMYFGGNSGVRAYSNNISGDDGAQLNLNYFYNLPNMPWLTRVGGFVDYAIGRISHSPWEGELTGANTFHLNAIGVQADVSYRKLRFNASLAHPLTTSAVDRDQKWRLWTALRTTF